MVRQNEMLGLNLVGAHVERLCFSQTEFVTGGSNGIAQGSSNVRGAFVSNYRYEMYVPSLGIPLGISRGFLYSVLKGSDCRSPGRVPPVFSQRFPGSEIPKRGREARPRPPQTPS